MTKIIVELSAAVPGCVGCSDSPGGYRLDFEGSTSRLATSEEILGAAKAARIAAVNAECRTRLIARFGDAAEQVSRSIGVYGATEKAAMETGIAATIDASNTASNAVIAAADIAAVEEVTVAWPVI